MHHPDRGGDKEVMKKINGAYHVLSRNKEEYDARLRIGGRRPVVIIRRAHPEWGGSTDNTTTFTWTFNN